MASATASEERRRAHLYLKNDRSDKEYVIELLPGSGGWFVSYAYGKRGRSLRYDTKTPEPLSYDNAVRIYNNALIRVLNKGYTPDAPEGPYANHNPINRSILQKGDDHVKAMAKQNKRPCKARTASPQPE